MQLMSNGAIGRLTMDMDTMSPIAGIGDNQPPAGTHWPRITAVVSGIALCSCVPFSDFYLKSVGDISGTYTDIPRGPTGMNCQWSTTLSGLTTNRHNSADCSGDPILWAEGWIISVWGTTASNHIRVRIGPGLSLVNRPWLFEGWSDEPCFPCTIYNAITGCGSAYANGFYPVGYGGSVTLSLQGCA